jgi:homoserine O-succinyltransferase/O-acetyltransferase
LLIADLRQPLLEKTNNYIMQAKLKLALLDLYDGEPNQGMRCIKDILNRYRNTIDWQLFDVRQKAEVPDLDFDIYLSSGGPGSPIDGNGVWDARYFDWLESVWQWNAQGNFPKKHVFFICHSFQMACRHFKIGKVAPRHSISFGTFPMHMTDRGIDEPIFSGLPNPFWAADFRKFQVTEPNLKRLDELGAESLALEKIRPYVPYDRALMAVRFSPEIMGVQFHPEADAAGMLEHFRNEERRQYIIETHDEVKYRSMMRDLANPDKIALTNRTVIPNFLNQAIEALQAVAAA